MKKKFPLSVLLDYRKLTLEKEEDRLSKLFIRRNNAKKNLEDSNQMIVDKRQQLQQDIENGLFLETDMYDKFLKLSIIQAARYEQELNSISEAVVQQQRVVTKALQNVEIIKKLESEHKDNYRIYINKLEQKELDELNILRSGINER